MINYLVTKGSITLYYDGQTKVVAKMTLDLKKFV